MSITPTLNMIIGGMQVAQLPGAAAVTIFNLIYEGRELAHTHDAFQKISELRPLAQAINIRLTPNAPRLQAAGAKTELLFSPFEALSLFHIIGQNIALRQTELAFVTGRIASNQTHDEADDEISSSNEVIAHELCHQLVSAQMHQLAVRLPVEGITPERTADYSLALAILEEHGDDAVQAALTAMGIDFIHPDEEEDEDDEADDQFPDESLSDEEQEFAAEIQDQISDDDTARLLKEFITEEDEDDELDILLDTVISKYGIKAVNQKIIDLNIAFDSDVADIEDEDDDAEDGGFVADEEEGRSAPSDYALTVLRNDLEALHHNDLVILTEAVEMTAQDSAAMTPKVDFLMENPSYTLDALEAHGIKVPNFEAVQRAVEEDEDREERLHRLDIQDLEILCDVLGINRVDQEHDDLIDILCCRPQSEFESALELTGIDLPDLDYSDDEPTVEDYRENFTHIAGLTMLQSAVAQSIAEGQDLVLSFTH